MLATAGFGGVKHIIWHCAVTNNVVLLIITHRLHDHYLIVIGVTDCSQEHLHLIVNVSINNSNKRSIKQHDKQSAEC